MRSRHRMSILLLAALVAGCLPWAAPESTPPPLAPPGTLPGPSAPPAPTASPTPASVAVPELVPCPVPAGAPTAPDLADPALTVRAVLEYLNAGGSADLLVGLLQAAGHAPNAGQPVRSLDINGDTWLDLAVAFVDPNVPRAQAHLPLRPKLQPPARGAVAIYLCQGTRYVPGDPVLEAPDATPLLHLAADLNRDGVTDLLVGWETCGAHTCYQQLDVVMAAGTFLVRARLDPTLDLPYPEVQHLSDGRLAVTGTGIASAGAGPFRQVTRTWAWDAAQQGFAVVSETLEAPRYRIHALLDAQAAARRGDGEAALDLYHRVILDESLLDWADPETERANLRAFGMYRVVVTYASQGDLGDARVAYGILQNEFVDGSTGQIYARLAKAFWDVFEQTADLRQSCLAARAFAEAHRTAVLDPLYFGYANPAFTPGDVCPANDT